MKESRLRVGATFYKFCVELRAQCGDKAYLAKAKKEINFALKDSLRGGLTSYDLDLNKIAGIKVSGDMIEFHADGKQDMRA